MVRLNLIALPLPTLARIGFNSTMVRLNLADLVRSWRSGSLFQFHNGSIKSSRFPLSSYIPVMFQFHNGSIKSPVSLCFSDRLGVFQFHNGSIKSVLQGRKCVTYACFNSTMVRLNRGVYHNGYVWFIKFQFHNGSIKSIPRAFSTESWSSFQFHNGSIKSLRQFQDNLPVLCFNSTMVRLNPVGICGEQRGEIRFQFHNGSIKSWESLSLSLNHRGFNSTMVRLNPICPDQSSGLYLGFNSTMVRLNPWNYCCWSWSYNRFNSTMVRLNLGK